MAGIRDPKKTAAGEPLTILNLQDDKNKTKTKWSVSETVSEKCTKLACFWGWILKGMLKELNFSGPITGQKKGSKPISSCLKETFIFSQDWILMQNAFQDFRKIKIRHSPQNSAHNIGRKNSMFIHQSHKECGRIRPWKSSSGFPKFPFFFLLTIF